MLHLNSVKSLVPDASVQARVEDVLQTLVNAVQGFQQLHWIQLRHTLARFLKDKRVKVCLSQVSGTDTVQTGQKHNHLLALRH